MADGPRHAIDNVTTPGGRGLPDRWGWFCNTCFATDVALTEYERNQQKEAHQVLAQRNDIPHPVDMKERHLVTQPMIKQVTTKGLVCGIDACDIPEHVWDIPTGTSVNQVRAGMTMHQRRVFELEHQLAATQKAADAILANKRTEMDVELKRLRRKVVGVARKYAHQHNWCGEVDEALLEIGLNPNEGARWLTLSFDVYVTTESLVAVDIDTPAEAWNNDRNGVGTTLIWAERDEEDSKQLFFDFGGIGNAILDISAVRVEKVQVDLAR